jgi:CelD/BcsL family acetyltransferase involved in cellulose biosynthesis
MPMRIVDSEEEFIALKPAWDEVFRSNQNHTPFQSWEWNYAWWKYYGIRGRLRLVVVEERGTVIGIAPMYLKTRYRGWPLVHLAFISHRRADYLDFVVRAGVESVFFRRLFSCLRDGKMRYTIVDLRDIPETSTNLPHLLGEGREFFAVVRCQSGEICVSAPLASTWSGFLASMRIKARSNAGRYRRRLEQECSISLKIPELPEDSEKCLDDFAAVYQSRWRPSQGATFFDDPRATGFEREVCRLGSEAGWYRLYILYANGTPVAGMLGYVWKDKCYSGLLAHRPEFRKYGVGAVLVGMTIEDCIKHSLLEFDMGRGDEPYKFEWNGVAKYNCNIRMSRGRAAFAIMSVVDWVYGQLVGIKALHWLRSRWFSWQAARKSRAAVSQ